MFYNPKFYFFLFFLRTFDILSSIDLTDKTIDLTSILYQDDNSTHIWILLRSTRNTLQVWNQSSCKLHATISLNNLFNKIGKTNEQIAAMEEKISDEDVSSALNGVRITSFLIHDEQIWIGTSTGIIFVYGFSFQLKSVLIKSRPRSLSLTNPLIDENKLKESDRKKCQSDSALILTEQDLLSNVYHSNTTLTSTGTRSSSSAVLSSDENHSKHSEMKLQQEQAIDISTSATLSFNLIFKAKIADAPIKCICKTKYEKK
jgi:hypothetical protein